jgi:hypothetical protein
VVFDGLPVPTSLRVLVAVAIIDKSSGEFVWMWGRDQLGHPHDPNLLGSGNILMFDNGWHGATASYPSSTVIEIDPWTADIQSDYGARPLRKGTTGGLFEVARGGEIVWESVNPFFEYAERLGYASWVFPACAYSPDFPGWKGKDLYSEQFAWLNHLYKP